MSRRKKSPDRRKPERQSGIQSPKDRCEALDAIVRAFTHPQGMERHMTQSLWRGEVFNPAHTRVTVADGRVVSAVTMAPRMMRFGPVGIPAMTIGPVGTHDHYRKRGYSAAAMNDASDYMAREGCMLAYLQGIPDYYYRFGYYPFMAPSHVKFNRDAARKQSLPGRLRAMTVRDVPAVRRIYDKVTAGRIGPAKRDKAVWEWLLGPGTKTWLFVGPKVILDGDGKECGYLTMDAKGALRIREIVVDPSEKSIRAALGAVTREARRRESREVTLPLPWDDPLAVFVRQCVGAEFTMHSNATGGPVLKIVNLPALMQALEPLFQERWGNAGMAVDDVTFRFRCELGSVGLTIADGRVSVGPVGRGRNVRVGRRWLSGLLSGYHSVADVASREGVSIPASLKPVLQVLFPSGCPFVYQADNY